ncbi:endonuclease/exonuclease/phosphatase family protein [Paracoccus pacificus]|uniref:Endonuclease/exonuclease/phosphatase family protein n=1 Tax=Paracoccus pacificus TaxID=1463598 RepID=A0ABW4R3L2_9RHOB
MFRALALSLLLAAPAMADSIRIATFSPDLTRKGPGLLLSDLQEAKDPQIAAVVQVIAASRADVLLLTGIDWDYDGLALRALADRLEQAGAPYPYRYAGRPNTGMATEVDMDGDGRVVTPEDAQGFGFFSGQGGMAILSRLPLGTVTDMSDTLWRDVPGNSMNGAGLSTAAAEIQRLSTTAHWDVPVNLPGGTALHLLAYAATPPVFDGPEDRNGRRNADESRFWLSYLDRLKGAPFVILGDANLDPVDGEGRPDGIQSVLNDPRVQDPKPASPGGRAAGAENPGQKGDPSLDTADWPDADGPGNLRVDYVLPASTLRIKDAGVLWPAPPDPLAPVVTAASRHRLVWVDLNLP